jgi:HPt (histidine-containing phosphotransfer) domain-containing protein
MTAPENSVQELRKIDWDYLFQNYDFDDPDELELLEDLARSLQAEMVSLLIQLEDCTQGGLWKEAKAIVHRMKSSFGNIGMSKASGACAEIQNILEAGNVEAGSSEIGKLLSAQETILSGLEGLLARIA